MEHPTPSVLFILSASYCDPELQAEFGAKIPSCFVPIGPRRLLDLQIREARNIPGLEHIFVALPPGFVTDINDKDVQTVALDSASMEHTFEYLKGAFLGWYSERNVVFNDDLWHIHVLNGDTLVRGSSLWSLGALHTTEKLTFSMSKEWSATGGKPNNTEYAGKVSFQFRHSDLARDPLFYGSYMNIVRSAKKVDVAYAEWLDFGHGDTYYQSKRNLLSSRAFNRVQLTDRGRIVKTGDGDKMRAELEWYRNVPENVAIYTPQVTANLGTRSKIVDSYQMEYIPCPTLAELLVYGNRTTDFWTSLFEARVETLLVDMTRDLSEGYVAADGLLMQKTKSRVKDLHPTHKKRADELIAWVESNEKECPAVVHGDLCFSNILFDRRAEALKVIDPRGYDFINGVFGNQLYDLAKLYHSCAGLYDFHMANRKPTKGQLEITSLLARRIEWYAERVWGVSRKTLVAMTGLLFYSMLPLHTDDTARMLRLVGQASKMYSQWKELA